MERFRILKRTYGSGAIVFIPQRLYSSQNGWYKNVCDEMMQAINSFETEEEAKKKIDEYKKFKKDSKIISDEIIKLKKYRIKEYIFKSGKIIFYPQEFYNESWNNIGFGCETKQEAEDQINSYEGCKIVEEKIHYID